MGFFSWKTQDTDKSIPSKHSIKPTFKVYMKDNEGNMWEEDDYEGYGVFGDKDYYELVAEMNGFNFDNEDKQRSIGISIDFGISGVISCKTGKIYLGSGKDFFIWSDPIENGLSANEMLEQGLAQHIKVEFDRAKFPTLSESPDFNAHGDKPDRCEHQGYFY